jgi:hypothetical protein
MGTVNAKLGFTNPDHVLKDTERPGMLRARTLDLDFYNDPDLDLTKELDIHDVSLQDWSAPDAPTLDLWNTGFDCIDLTGVEGLVDELNKVRQANYLDHESMRIIRKKMSGKKFRLSNGKTLRILFIAGDGFLLRKGGPNSLRINPGEELTGNNGHFSAPIIHGDQDVFGTPVKRILKGLAPRIFRHKTPDALNSKSPVFLVNIWMPLQQITQPLALLDRQTLDQQRHQLRYATPVDDFLKRKGGEAMNDIWMFLYDKSQRWCFNPEMYAGKAYVFDTLGEAHGGVTVSGEEVAEQYYLALKAIQEAIEVGDQAALQSTTVSQAIPYPDDISAPLGSACDQMHALIHEASRKSLDQLKTSGWVARAKAAMDKVVRKSIEMRAAVWVS